MNDLLGLRSSAFASSLLSPPSVRLSPVSSLLILVFLVSGLLHPLSHVCCLRRLSPVPCCESKAGSRCRSDLHAAPSQHTRRAKPRGMHNLRTCRNSRHAESLGVQNLDACRTSGHAEHRATRTCPALGYSYLCDPLNLYIIFVNIATCSKPKRALRNNPLKKSPLQSDYHAVPCRRTI